MKGDTDNERAHRLWNTDLASTKPIFLKKITTAENDPMPLSN